MSLLCLSQVSEYLSCMHLYNIDWSDVPFLAVCNSTVGTSYSVIEAGHELPLPDMWSSGTQTGTHVVYVAVQQLSTCMSPLINKVKRFTLSVIVLHVHAHVCTKYVHVCRILMVRVLFRH